MSYREEALKHAINGRHGVNKILNKSNKKRQELNTDRTAKTNPQRANNTAQRLVPIKRVREAETNYLVEDDRPIRQPQRLQIETRDSMQNEINRDLQKLLSKSGLSNPWDKSIEEITPKARSTVKINNTPEPEELEATEEYSSSGSEEFVNEVSENRASDESSEEVDPIDKDEILDKINNLYEIVSDMTTQIGNLVKMQKHVAENIRRLHLLFNE